jgi:hypothetical protein
VRVSVEVEPAEARLSDEPTLTLTIDAERGVKVEPPPFGESLGEFLIRDFREPLPEVRGQREILRKVYTLEPTRTGQLQIDPIAVSFTDERPGQDGKQHQLETEAVTVKVTSVLGSDVPSLDQLEALAQPVELPAGGSAILWWLLAGLALAGSIGGLAGWRWLARRRVAPEHQYTPQELAYIELERLIESDLIRQDVKQFYVELTGIVRRYIERTTGVHAPEQTTEEFLREISAGNVFPASDRERLRSFLESADLVKFAAYEPRSADLEETFERAKSFLGLQSREVAA